MPFNPGDIICNRYRVKKQLGSGNWGVTYLVTDLQALNSNSQCVVKEINQSSDLDLEESETYFQREVEALQSLGTHPQIPMFIDSFIQEEYFYIVQEFIDGNILKEKINPGKTLTENEAKKLLIDILKIVQFIHKNNHVHRDLKPDNIIQRRNGKIVIIDFGTVKEISTLERTDSGDTHSELIGSPYYMPPERYHFPRPPEVDRSFYIDIYSIGIIGLQMVTGLAPDNLHTDPYNDGARLWSDAISVSDGMKRILERMAHPKPICRYQSAAEVIEDLQQLPEDTFIKTTPVFRPFSKIKILGVSLISLIAGASLMRVVPELLYASKTEDYYIDFEKVCESPAIKGEAFKNHTGKAIYTKESIWSVFGWKCKFTYKNDEGKRFEQIGGIDLNDYCAEKYGGQYEAYYKYFYDRNSWYCTDVGTKLESK